MVLSFSFAPFFSALSSCCSDALLPLLRLRFCPVFRLPCSLLPFPAFWPMLVFSLWVPFLALPRPVGSGFAFFSVCVFFCRCLFALFPASFCLPVRVRLVPFVSASAVLSFFPCAFSLPSFCLLPFSAQPVLLVFFFFPSRLLFLFLVLRPPSCFSVFALRSSDAFHQSSYIGPFSSAFRAEPLLRCPCLYPAFPRAASALPRALFFLRLCAGLPFPPAWASFLALPSYRLTACLGVFGLSGATSPLCTSRSCFCPPSVSSRCRPFFSSQVPARLRVSALFLPGVLVSFLPVVPLQFCGPLPLVSFTYASRPFHRVHPRPSLLRLARLAVSASMGPCASSSVLVIVFLLVPLVRPFHPRRPFFPLVAPLLHVSPFLFSPHKSFAGLRVPGLPWVFVLSIADLMLYGFLPFLSSVSRRAASPLASRASFFLPSPRPFVFFCLFLSCFSVGSRVSCPVLLLFPVCTLRFSGCLFAAYSRGLWRLVGLCFFLKDAVGFGGWFPFLSACLRLSLFCLFFSPVLFLHPFSSGFFASFSSVVFAWLSGCFLRAIRFFPPSLALSSLSALRRLSSVLFSRLLFTAPVVSFVCLLGAFACFLFALLSFFTPHEPLSAFVGGFPFRLPLCSFLFGCVSFPFRFFALLSSCAVLGPASCSFPLFASFLCLSFASPACSVSFSCVLCPAWVWVLVFFLPGGRLSWLFVLFACFGSSLCLPFVGAWCGLPLVAHSGGSPAPWRVRYSSFGLCCPAGWRCAVGLCGAASFWLCWRLLGGLLGWFLQRPDCFRYAFFSLAVPFCPGSRGLAFCFLLAWVLATPLFFSLSGLNCRVPFSSVLFFFFGVGSGFFGGLLVRLCSLLARALRHCLRASPLVGALAFSVFGFLSLYPLPLALALLSPSSFRFLVWLVLLSFFVLFVSLWVPLAVASFRWACGFGLGCGSVSLLRPRLSSLLVFSLASFSRSLLVVFLVSALRSLLLLSRPAVRASSSPSPRVLCRPVFSLFVPFP